MRRLAVLISFISLLFGSFAIAQEQAATKPTVDPQVLLDRIQQLEKRIQELEARTATPAADKQTTATPAVSTGNSSGADVTQQVEAAAVKESVDKDQGLKIRGFGQATFIADDVHGDRPSINAGNLTLLMTSKL